MKKAEPQQNLQSVDDRAKLDGEVKLVINFREKTTKSIRYPLSAFMRYFQASTSASSVPAAAPLVPATGGMETGPVPSLLQCSSINVSIQISGPRCVDAGLQMDH